MSGGVAAVSLGMSAASTIMGAVGQANAGAASAAQANYQAQLARNNQQIAEWNAQRALQQGQVAEQQQRFKTSQVIGSQRAALASQGGDVNSGSPLDIVGDSARAGEFDAQTIRNNAAMQAYGFRVQAANAGAQSELYRQSAANTMDALPFSIGSSLLGGASSLFDKGLGFYGRGYFSTRNPSSQPSLPGTSGPSFA
jgi:hypothetical protein